MGLDIVELVLRTEQLYSITLPDDEAARVRTVADLYHLVCAKLDDLGID
jgi:acyl carrier protein